MNNGSINEDVLSLKRVGSKEQGREITPTLRLDDVDTSSEDDAQSDSEMDNEHLTLIKDNPTDEKDQDRKTS